MHETRNHFVAICPGCSASLRVNRKTQRPGRQTANLQAQSAPERASGPFTPNVRRKVTAGSSIQPPPPIDRINAQCPSCQATLSVRRIYIGNQVRCKQCGGTFLVREPASSAGTGAASARNRR